jgi:hypothetical protein
VSSFGQDDRHDIIECWCFVLLPFFVFKILRTSYSIVNMNILYKHFYSALCDVLYIVILIMTIYNNLDYD